MINLSVCPICSGNSFTDFLICKDYTTSQENFTLKKCSACGFTVTDPSPDECSIGNYYLSEKYISHTGGGKSLIDRIYLAARNIALGNKRRIIQRSSNGNTILDFGCGTGEFLKEMKDNGWQVCGVEPSDIANAKASDNTKTKVYKSLRDIEQKNIDVITLWHVLEHVHDLNGTLQNFVNLMSNSGTIFIAVPNLESYDAKFYQSHWAGYDVPRHLWHFSKENMKMLLAKNGLQLQEILPMKMDSFYVSLLSESYAKPGQSKVLSLISAFWRGLISNMKAGKNNYSSLIYIAKR
ncbi:hypothetical protein WSM22_15210 [Cytophagales bacterium WSM2-2]|nr:hypothetical protein WSM22_15210 [Cytophagales bacterium WSM2-2]